MTTKAEILEQQKLLAEQLKLVEAKDKAEKAFAVIRQGYEDTRPDNLTYEEVREEWDAGVTQPLHKGVHFQTSLRFERDYLFRDAKITKIDNWEPFIQFRGLLREYNFRNHHYRSYWHIFDRIPYIFTCSTGRQEFVLGELESLTILHQWSFREKFSHHYSSKGKLSLVNSVQAIKDQIDLIEKIGLKQTDERDDVLPYYTDEQLNYELEKRKQLIESQK